MCLGLRLRGCHTTKEANGRFRGQLCLGQKKPRVGIYVRIDTDTVWAWEARPWEARSWETKCHRSTDPYVGQPQVRGA